MWVGSWGVCPLAGVIPPSVPVKIGCQGFSRVAPAPFKVAPLSDPPAHFFRGMGPGLWRGPPSLNRFLLSHIAPSKVPTRKFSHSCQTDERESTDLWCAVGAGPPQRASSQGPVRVVSVVGLDQTERGPRRRNSRRRRLHEALQSRPSQTPSARRDGRNSKGVKLQKSPHSIGAQTGGVGAEGAGPLGRGTGRRDGCPLRGSTHAGPTVDVRGGGATDVPGLLGRHGDPSASNA